MSAVAESTSKGGFVFGESVEEGTNKVLGVLPLETYLVQYTDGAGKKCVRVAFKAPGAQTSFILQEKIQGAFVATTGTEWFNRALSAKLEERNKKDVESV